MHKLAPEEINVVIEALQNVPTHSRFLLDHYCPVNSPKKFNAIETGWLVDNGFATRPTDITQENMMYITLTPRGRDFVALKSFKAVRLKEKLDNSIKYISMLLSIVAIIISILSFLRHR